MNDWQQERIYVPTSYRHHLYLSKAGHFVNLHLRHLHLHPECNQAYKDRNSHIGKFLGIADEAVIELIVKEVHNLFWNVELMVCSIMVNGIRD